jgi:hypothetical protein
LDIDEVVEVELTPVDDDDLETTATGVVRVGDRVEAVHFGPSKVIDDNITVPPGTQGTVHFIDDTGTVHVQWDNGARLGLVPEHDHWKDLS